MPIALIVTVKSHKLWVPSRLLPLPWLLMEQEARGGLTHIGRVALLSICKLHFIGSATGLSPGWHRAIIRTNAGISLIGPLGTNISGKLLIPIRNVSTHENAVANAVWRMVAFFASATMCYTFTPWWLHRTSWGSDVTDAEHSFLSDNHWLWPASVMTAALRQLLCCYCKECAKYHKRSLESPSKIDNQTSLIPGDIGWAAMDCCFISVCYLLIIVIHQRWGCGCVCGDADGWMPMIHVCFWYCRIHGTYWLVDGSLNVFYVAC